MSAPDTPPGIEPLPGLVDAHAHAWSRAFDGDRAVMLARAWSAGLRLIVEVGVDVSTSLGALQLARRAPRVVAVAGLHPHEARHLEREREALAALVGGGGFVGIGEIGLDFYRNFSPPEAQYAAFRWQLALAREHALPVVVHSRAADAETFEVLEEWSRRVGRYLGREREIGMLHCFAGDVALAARYVELGFLISVPGTVTYPSNTRGQEVACTIPLEAMTLETDCPYLTPVPRRGERNEPAYVAHTARYVAGLRGIAAERVAQTTGQNALRLFGVRAPERPGSRR